MGSKSSANPFWDEEKVTAALRRAVREALELHRRLGNPVCVWRDSKVIWLSPEELPVYEGEVSSSEITDR